MVVVVEASTPKASTLSGSVVRTLRGGEILPKTSTWLVYPLRSGVRLARRFTRLGRNLAAGRLS